MFKFLSLSEDAKDYTPEEIEEIKEILRGTVTRNSKNAKRLAKLGIGVGQRKKAGGGYENVINKVPDNFYDLGLDLGPNQAGPNVPTAPENRSLNDRLDTISGKKPEKLAIEDPEISEKNPESLPDPQPASAMDDEDTHIKMGGEPGADSPIIKAPSLITDPSQVIETLKSFVAEHGAKGNKGAMYGDAEMISRLIDPDDEEFGEDFEERLNNLQGALDEESRYMEHIGTNWDDLSSFEDFDGARSFLEKGLGLKETGGRLGYGDVNPAWRLAHSQPLNDKNKGYRGIQLRNLAQLLLPSVQGRLKNNSRESIQASSIINPNITWEMAEEIYDNLLDPSMAKSLNDLGGANALHQAFDPKVPVRNTKVDGVLTGKTNIDDLRNKDYEEYKEQFSDSSGRGRGVFNLMRILQQGGRDGITMLPGFLDGRTGTIDHLRGRGQREAGDNPIIKDSPLNTILTSNDVNWFKADNAMKGEKGNVYDNDNNPVLDEDGNPVEKAIKDSLEGLVDGVGKFQDGSVMKFFIDKAKKIKDDDERQQFVQENMSKLWLANRVSGQDLVETIFDPRKPQSIDELTDPEKYSNKNVKDILDKQAMNVRSLGMYFPRIAHPEKSNENAWSGSLGVNGSHQRQYGEGLDGWRRPQIALAHFGPKITEKIADRKAQIDGKDWDDEKKAKELIAFSRQLYDFYIGSPQRARSMAWTTGLAGTDEYMEQMNGMTESALGGLDATEPQLRSLRQGSKKALDLYHDEIKNKGLSKIPRVSDEWLVNNLQSNPIRNLIFSQYGRSKLPQDFLRDHVEPAIDKGDFSKPFGGEKPNLFTGPISGGKANEPKRDYVFNYDQDKTKLPEDWLTSKIKSGIITE